MGWAGAGGVALRIEMTGIGDTTLVLMHKSGGRLERWD
jgi:hypothetical protein